MPTKRLNISLINDDGTVIEQLRTVYEKQLGKRLSFAEVVRMAVKAEAERTKQDAA